MLYQTTLVFRLSPLCIRRIVQIQWHLSSYFYYLGLTCTPFAQSTKGTLSVGPYLLQTYNMTPASPLKVYRIDSHSP